MHQKLHIDAVFGKGRKKQGDTSKPVNNLEAQFAQMWLAFNGADLILVPQVRFHETREWRFDFAIPSRKVAFEIQGGTYVRGAHSRGKQQTKDFEKHNEAIAAGWRLFYLDTKMLEPARIADEVAKLTAWIKEGDSGQITTQE